MLVSLVGIAVVTLVYVDAPVTDELLFAFIKSDKFLPAKDTIERHELLSPARELLAQDRRGYKGILYLVVLAGLGAAGLFFSSTSLTGSRKPVAAPDDRTRRPWNAEITGGPPPHYPDKTP